MPDLTGRGMRRALLALASATALAAFGLPATGVARTAHAAGRTVHVIEHANTDDEIPTGGGKDVKGNILTFVNPIYNAANTRQVGHDEGFCTRLDPQKGVWECLWTTFVNGGQITVQGPFYDTRNSTLAITGGTGPYRNARGQMKLVSRNGGKAYDFIFELS
ncbi:MAG TPA: dirigent protein [Solirubrobacteraceae bacterium]|nr:dirigent protein [Solirubrobacteraceae bacterium]